MRKSLQDNIGLIHSYARKYKNSKEYMLNEYGDLFGQAVLGFCAGLRRFFPEEGAFPTYITSWVQKYIMELLDRTNSGKVSLDNHELDFIIDFPDNRAENPARIEEIRYLRKVLETKIFKELDEKDRVIAAHLFGINKDNIFLPENIIAEMLGVSKQAVNQRVASLLQKIRHIIMLRRPSLARWPGLPEQ